MMLALADLEEMDEAAVKAHIANEYSGTESGFAYGNPSDADRAKAAEDLERFDVLIAYEHVGSWGCDSASWFLMRDEFGY